MKISIFDRRVFAIFLEATAYISAIASMVFIFVEIPSSKKILFGFAFAALLLVAYLIIWIRSNRLNEVTLKVDGSTVIIKAGDIFSQAGLKAIAFNEYFDTIVDNKLISDVSLNGVFIRSHVPAGVADLDAHLANYDFEPDEIVAANSSRLNGKQVRYKIGTICVYGDYLLAAFAKFDEQNKAHLTMPEYLGFLITFWDKVNKVYAQKSVSTPIFGSGITRIKEHKNITDEDLLKIMLWTFRISEMRFKHPAKLTIVIHKDKISQVNLLDISSARNGL